MIHLENVLKISLQDVLKMSWRRLEDVFKTSWKGLEDFLETFCKTSWRSFEDVLKTSWQDVLKMPWRRLEDVLKTLLQDVLKTSWKRLEDILARRLEDVLKTYGQDEYIGLDQDVFWRRKAKANIFALIKTSSRRPPLKTKTKDVSKTSPRRLHQNDWLLGK